MTGRLLQHASCWLALATLSAAALSAQNTEPARTDASVADTGRVFQLGTIEVRAPESVPQNILTERVTAAKLRINTRNDLARALTLFPGVTVSNIGPRNESGANVRGFDLRQVPLFIDGIPVYVPYDGYVDLRRFTTFDAAEITVSKGMSSVLLGPNALGGAINVVSRQPSETFEASGGTSAFLGRGLESYLNVGGRRGMLYGQASGSVLRQEMYPLSKKFTAVPTQGGGDRGNARRRDSRISAKLGMNTQRGDEYAIGYANQTGEKGNPLYAGTAPTTVRFWKWPQWDKRSGYAMSRTSLGANTYLNGRVYYDRFDNVLKSYNNATYTTQTAGFAFTSIYHDQTYGGSAELGTTMADHKIGLALHTKLDKHNEHNVGEPERNFRDRTSSIALEDVYDIAGPLAFIGGVSYERRSALHAEALGAGNAVIPLAPGKSSAWNPEIAGIYDLGTSGSLRASIARKTRFPTIKDRYSYRMGQAIPNPDLTSEHGTHYELRYATKETAAWGFQVNVFMSRLDDAIQRVDSVQQTGPTTWVFQLQNVGQAEARGAEVSATHTFRGWIATTASYSVLTRKNITKPAIKFTDTPGSTASANVVLTPTSWFGFVANLDINNWRYTTTGGQKVAGFGVADAKAMFNVRRDLSVDLGVDNVFDRNYVLTYGYPEPGRVARVSMRYAIAGGNR